MKKKGDSHKGKMMKHSKKDYKNKLKLMNKKQLLDELKELEKQKMKTEWKLRQDGYLVNRIGNTRETNADLKSIIKNIARAKTHLMSKR